MASVCRQPATTIAEDQLVPACAPEVQKGYGAWKPASILSDNIAIEAGFSKTSYEAASFSMEFGGETWRFVHVRKQNAWFVAAVGGPMLRVICQL